MRPPTRERRGSLEIKMTPMIDVVFLLLIFFLWASHFDEPEFDLDGRVAATDRMPRASGVTPTATPEAFDEVVVRLVDDGGRVEIRAGEAELADVSALEEYFREIANLGIQPPVIVDPDPAVLMSVVIACHDAARRAGMNRVLFAAEVRQ